MSTFFENFGLTLFIVFLLCIVVFVMNIILLVTHIKFKKRKIKIDIIIIEQIAINAIFSYYIMDYTIRNINQIIRSPGFRWIYSFSLVMLSSNIMLTIIREIELIFEMKRPLYIFTSIYNKKGKNLKWEIISIVITFIIFLIGQNSDLNSRDKQLGFYIKEENLILLFCLLLIISLGLNVYSLIYSCCIKSKNKKEYFIKIIIHIVYCIFLLGFKIFLLFAKYNNMKYNNGWSYISSYIVMLYLIINAICEMILIKQSDFYYYVIGQSEMSFFYKCCGKNGKYVPPVFRENVEYVDIKSQKDEILYHFLNDLHFTNVNTGSLERSEYCLNCALAGIYLIMEMERNQTNIENINNVANNYDIEMRNTQKQIHDTNLQRNLIEINHNNILIRSDKQFTFTNNDFSNNNELSTMINYNKNSFLEEQSTNSIKVQVKIDSIYHTTLTQITKIKNINIDNIKKSIISHVSTCPFLISINSKESTFPDLPSLTLISNDKQIFIQIFDSIDIKILKKYIEHIHQKQFTFFPTLIGIYKININSYFPFYILIIKNEIINSYPETIFNSWTLMKYNNNYTLQKIMSSQDRQSFIISNEIINDSDLKLKIKNLNTFKQILKDDFAYLKQIKSNSFTFMFIIYEIEKEQINKEDSFNFLNESDFNIDNQFPFNRESKQNNNPFVNDRISNFTERIPTIQNNDNTFISHNIIFRNSNSIKPRLNGFEGEKGSFICKVFFSFENIFEFRSRLCNKLNYNECMNQLLKYFENFRLNNET